MKWWATMRVAVVNQLAYRLNFLLLVVGPAIVFFFIKYHLWTTIFATAPEDVIQGYTVSEMIHYQIWVLVIGILSQGMSSFNIAEDIRLGRISAFLLYPFGFFRFHFSWFAALEVLQALVAVVTLLVLLALSILALPSPILLLQGFMISILVGFFWFGMQFIAGVMAFWLEETWVIRVIFITLAQFLSGALVPLEFYPDWLRNFLDYTPFPYVTFIPVKVFMGEYEHFWQALGILMIWTLLVFALGRLIWQRGLRRYTAAGI